MKDQDWIALSENQALKQFFEEQKEQIVERLALTPPDGSDDYFDRISANTAQLYLVQRMVQDLEDGAQAAREHLRKRQ